MSNKPKPAKTQKTPYAANVVNASIILHAPARKRNANTLSRSFGMMSKLASTNTKNVRSKNTSVVVKLGNASILNTPSLSWDKVED